MRHNFLLLLKILARRLIHLLYWGEVRRWAGQWLIDSSENRLDVIRAIISKCRPRWWCNFGPWETLLRLLLRKHQVWSEAGRKFLFWQLILFALSLRLKFRMVWSLRCYRLSSNNLTVRLLALATVRLCVPLCGCIKVSRLDFSEFGAITYIMVMIVFACHFRRSSSIKALWEEASGKMKEIFMPFRWWNCANIFIS